MWIPAHQRWPNTDSAPVNIQTQRATRLGESPGLFFISTQAFFSLCLRHKTNTPRAVYTPGRCVLCATGSQGSGPSPRTSPGRRSTACRRSSRRCLGWVARGWKRGLWREEVVSLRTHLAEIFYKLLAFPVYRILRGILNICKHQSLYISATRLKSCFAYWKIPAGGPHWPDENQYVSFIR